MSVGENMTLEIKIWLEMSVGENMTLERLKLWPMKSAYAKILPLRDENTILEIRVDENMTLEMKKMTLKRWKYVSLVL